MSGHYSIDLVSDDAGWWHGKCQCGMDLGAFPEAEDAADALMQHAFDVGFKLGYENRPSGPEVSE